MTPQSTLGHRPPLPRRTGCTTITCSHAEPCPQPYKLSNKNLLQATQEMNLISDGHHDPDELQSVRLRDRRHVASGFRNLS